MKNKIDSDYGYIGNGEVQYVYRYIHPNYPWLYVGRTDDLTRRIDEHDKNIRIYYWKVLLYIQKSIIKHKL